MCIYISHRSEALHFSPSGTVFKKEVTLRIGFNGSIASGNQAAIYKFNEQTLMWDEKPGSVTSLPEKAVRVKTTSFSTYAVFQRPTFVPAQPLVEEGKNEIDITQVVLICLVVVLLTVAMVFCYLKKARAYQNQL